MSRLLLALATAAALLIMAPRASAQVPDIQRYYYYPYVYFPQSYWPTYYRWPDARIPFQPAPPYMAYPSKLYHGYRYEFLAPQRYYRGFHFWLDQF
ncbi:MAG: hypothetical protein C4297_06860 [Gemmataceae bacterium]